MKKLHLYVILIVILLTVIIIFGLSKKAVAPTRYKTSVATPGSATAKPSNSDQAPASTPKSDLTEPVADFRSRVTKKPYGIYVTPKNSPISPERFTGFHTGADAEYQDVVADVPVFAVADGIVVLSEIASGYGGVFVIEIELGNTKHTVLHGHIRPSSLPKVGQKVTKGEQIAQLGTGYSSETDGERRHLHFAILADNSLNIKGYVATKSELAGWFDPLNYF